jgi:hypothetical protein
LCSTHYSQHYRAKQVHGTPTDIEPAPKPVCTECGKPARARGLCVTHYQQWRRTYTGKGTRRRMTPCIDDLPHVWANGACRLCLEPRPGDWV